MQYFKLCTSTVAFATVIGCLGCAGSSGSADDASADDSAAVAGSGGSSGSAASGSGGSSGSASSAGSSASDAGSTVVKSTGDGTVSSLTFDVTTLSQGGKYAPKNVGAIWIEDSSGAYVRSLEVWAGIRKRDLRLYVAALGSRSDADVTTSATLRAHKAHEVKWDLKDSSGNTVAPGKYKLLVDLTDRDGDGTSYSVDFDTSEGTAEITPASASYFNSMTLKLD